MSAVYWGHCYFSLSFSKLNRGDCTKEWHHCSSWCKQQRRHYHIHKRKHSLAKETVLYSRARKERDCQCVFVWVVVMSSILVGPWSLHHCVFITEPPLFSYIFRFNKGIPTYTVIVGCDYSMVLYFSATLSNVLWTCDDFIYHIGVIIVPCPS